MIEYATENEENMVAVEKQDMERLQTQEKKTCKIFEKGLVECLS